MSASYKAAAATATVAVTVVAVVTEETGDELSHLLRLQRRRGRGSLAQPHDHHDVDDERERERKRRKRGEAVNRGKRTSLAGCGVCEGLREKEKGDSVSSSSHPRLRGSG